MITKGFVVPVDVSVCLCPVTVNLCKISKIVRPVVMSIVSDLVQGNILVIVDLKQKNEQGVNKWNLESFQHMESFDFKPIIFKLDCS